MIIDFHNPGNRPTEKADVYETCVGGHLRERFSRKKFDVASVPINTKVTVPAVR